MIKRWLPKDGHYLLDLLFPIYRTNNNVSNNKAHSSIAKTHFSFITSYRPQTKFAKVMFSQVFVCPQGGGSQSLSRGLCPGGLSLGDGSVWKVSVWGGLSRGVSVRGDLCPGVFCLGSVSVQGDPPTVQSGRYASC